LGSTVAASRQEELTEFFRDERLRVLMVTAPKLPASVLALHLAIVRLKSFVALAGSVKFVLLWATLVMELLLSRELFLTKMLVVLLIGRASSEFVRAAKLLLRLVELLPLLELTPLLVMIVEVIIPWGMVEVGRASSSAHSTTSAHSSTARMKAFLLVLIRGYMQTNMDLLNTYV
jgi:hypothetical protein